MKTPRTDKAEFEVFDGQNLAAVVESEFARQLEREACALSQSNGEMKQLLFDTLGPVIAWANEYKDGHLLKEIHPVHAEIIRKIRALQ